MNTNCFPYYLYVTTCQLHLIRATSCYNLVIPALNKRFSTRSITLLRNKLNENVFRIVFSLEPIQIHDTKRYQPASSAWNFSNLCMGFFFAAKELENRSYCYFLAPNTAPGSVNCLCMIYRICCFLFPQEEMSSTLSEEMTTTRTKRRRIETLFHVGRRGKFAHSSVKSF